MDLHHRHSAATLEIGKSRCAVVQHPGQHHPDRPGPIAQTDRAEQGIDRRPGQVLTWAVAETDGSVHHQEMPVGRRDIGPARFETGAVDCGLDREGAGMVEDLGDQIGPVRAHVHDHAERRPKVSWQRLAKRADGADGAGGAADRDETRPAFVH